MSVVKDMAKRLAAPFLLRRGRGRWKSDLLHVLVDPVPGFAAADWMRTFAAEIPERVGSIEVAFASNYAEREALGADAEVYITAWCSSERLARCPRLTVLQLLTTGTEFLDGVSRPGLTVVTSRGITAPRVARHAMLLLLGLEQRIAGVFDRRRWEAVQQRIERLAVRPQSRAAGVVGLGNIGQAVARRLLGAGMAVSAADLRAAAAMAGVSMCPGGLRELLSTVDVAILCVPLTAVTRGMMGREELAAMKPSGYLINVARGAIIDERELVRALRRKAIAGAGLDVTVREPLPLLHPLRRCPNVLVTPHVAGSIAADAAAIRRRFARNIAALIEGRGLEGVV